MQYHPLQYFSNSLTNIGQMTANKQKKQTSSKVKSRAKSLLLLESKEPQKRVTSMVVKKDQEKSRCFSMKEGTKGSEGHTKSVKVENGKKKKGAAKRKPIILISQCQTPILGKYSNENANQKHLTTVGDLHSQQSETCSNINQAGTNISSNLCSLAKQTIQESTIKPPFSIKTNQKKGIFSIVSPKELRQNLDTTIDKLKNKQLTIQMLNRTIDTRLVDARQSRQRKENGKSREDIYEVQMNFYVEKISQLQKELHQKSKALKSANLKNEETSMLAKNCKKLLKDNIRLKDQLQLSFRQVTALKKLLLRKHEVIF